MHLWVHPAVSQSSARPRCWVPCKRRKHWVCSPKSSTPPPARHKAPRAGLQGTMTAEGIAASRLLGPPLPLGQSHACNPRARHWAEDEALSLQTLTHFSVTSFPEARTEQISQGHLLAGTCDAPEAHPPAWSQPAAGNPMPTSAQRQPSPLSAHGMGTRMWPSFGADVVTLGP